jgi:protein-disulfide isomerase
MDKKIIWGVVAAIAVFGFLTIVYFATSSRGSAKVYPQTKTINADDHVIWSKSKKHILTEYGDFQCPACGLFHQYIKNSIQNDKKITDNMTFVFRHFPLTLIHKHAQEAAYAAEAAGMQGKFFEMGDMLFDTQSYWEDTKSVTETFQGFAKKLNLNMSKYNADLKSDAVKKKVQKDIDSGTEIQLSSTPTFYLDGVKVEVTTLEEFKKLLETTAQK